MNFELEVGISLRISKDYPIDKKQDVQAMLYTFALKFLNSNELEKGKIDVVRELLKEGLLTKEQIAKVTKLTLEKIEEIQEDIVAL